MSDAVCDVTRPKLPTHLSEPYHAFWEHWMPVQSNFTVHMVYWIVNAVVPLFVRPKCKLFICIGVSIYA